MRFIKSMLVAIGSVLTLLLPNVLIYTNTANNLTEKILFKIEAFVNNIYLSINIEPLYLFFIVLGVYLLTIISDSKITTTKFQKTISIFLSLFAALGSIYSKDLVSLTVFFDGFSQIFKFIWFISSYYYLFERAQILFINLMSKDWHISDKYNFILNKFKNQPFKYSFIMLSLFYSVYLLLNYPGIIMGDSFRQIEESLGYSPIKSDNPMISSLFISFFIKFGIMLDSPNLGLFLHSIVQSLIVIFSLSFSLAWIQKISNNSILTFFSCVFFSVIPIVTDLIFVATKDVIAGAMVLVSITCIAIYTFYEEYFWSKKVYIIFILSLIFVILFRLNNKYVIILSIVTFILFALLKKELKHFKIIFLSTITLLFSLLVNTGLNTIAEEPYLTGRRESLSIPFQQTARYANFHDDEVTSDEKKVINNVLDYDAIKSNYDPTRSDRVKITHNNFATSEEMKDYFIVWFNQFKKHPITYIDSVFNQVYSMFYLNENNNVYYLYLTDASRNPGSDREKRFEEIGFLESPNIRKLQDIKGIVYKLWDSIPILSQLNNMSFHIVILLFIVGISQKIKKYRTLLITIPMMYILLTLVAGPIVQGYIRYTFPILITSPLLISCIIRELKSSGKESNNENINNYTRLQ